jgi:hypothetical protein
MTAAAAADVTVLVGIWTGVLCLMLILTVLMVRRRLRGQMGDLPRVRLGARFAYLAVIWTYLLFLVFGVFWITGHALIAVAVLIGYTLLWLASLMVMVVIIARREAQRDQTLQATDSEDD